MKFTPFKQQREYLLDEHRTKVLIAAKRSGKSEAAYIETIIKADKQPGYDDNGIDPYKIAIIAPTDNMLRRLVWPKFRAFAKPFEREFNKTDGVFLWNTNNTIIIGVSAEKIQRIEGQKLNHVLLTEAFQMHQDVFFEVLARLSDSEGSLTIEGSLGTNFNNPKAHWIYREFVEKEFPDSRVWEWTTADNPYFPKAELDRMRDALDPRTYRQLFEIDWNVPGTALVYDEFDERNLIRGYQYNAKLPTYISIDWGWAHPMACLFFQYDPRIDTVYLFDEIVSSRLTLQDLYNRILAKPYRISAWVCDIAGTQEREALGKSNVQWFRERGIIFKHRRTAVNYGIPLVRTYIRDGKGRTKFFIDEVKCPKSVDGMKNYSYPEKNGMIQNENPVKKDDDVNDAIRYMYVNLLDKKLHAQQVTEINRWSLHGRAR